MANTVYPLAREEFLGADLDWDAHTFKVAALDSSYTYSAAHQDYVDLGASVLATSAALASKTKTNGYADAADTSVTPAGSLTIKSLVIYRDTGTPANDRLVYFADTTSLGQAISFDTDGSPVSINWSASGIFRI